MVLWIARQAPMNFTFLGALPLILKCPYPTVRMKNDGVINPGLKFRVVV
jgi:hypothetical protein